MEGETHRSMEQNRKVKKKKTQKCMDLLFLTKIQKLFYGEMRPFSTTGVRVL